MNSIDVLWNGWRDDYLSALPGRSKSVAVGHDGDSVFTKILRSKASDEESFIIYRGELCFCILNAFPYAVGHLMVLPMRQVADLSSLTALENAELWSLVTTATEILTIEYGPHGFNVGINLGAAAGGSVNEHLHVHVVPRWRGDANFLSSVANAKTISEPLATTADRLRRSWYVSANKSDSSKNE